MTECVKPNTVSPAYLQALFDYTRSRSLPDALLLNGLQLNLQDSDARCSETDAATLFDRAAMLLGDDALGLHVGECIRPGHYGVLGYVAMNCSTLGQTLDYLRRYQALVVDLGGVDITIDSDSIILTWAPDEGQPLRQLAEFNWAALISFMRWISGRDGAPLRIDFNYPAPAQLDEHRRLFACELRFDQPCYQLVLPLDWLSAPLIQPDATMHAAMLRLAEKQLLALPRDAGILSRARSLIATRLSEGPVELAWVACQLAVSTRKLQRMLQDEGLSFRGVVDEVRRELAKHYLADASLDVIDLAFLLGFSEQSAFQRAFKRWTGCTPGDYRRQSKRESYLTPTSTGSN